MREAVPPVFAGSEPEDGADHEHGTETPARSWPPDIYEARSEEGSVEERLRQHIEAFPDFPRAGILFQDLMPVLQEPDLFRNVVERFAADVQRVEADAIAAIESRGFLFAAPLSIQSGRPLLAVRKQGKLPGRTLRETYALEYGEAELEIQADAIQPGSRVYIVDDLLATGGTLEAACRLVERAGGTVAGLGVVVELAALDGAARLAGRDLMALLRL